MGNPDQAIDVLLNCRKCEEDLLSFYRVSCVFGFKNCEKAVMAFKFNPLLVKIVKHSRSLCLFRISEKVKKKIHTKEA